MKATKEHHQRIAQLTFAEVYSHYCTKVKRKGRTKAELHKVVTWLTGFDDVAIQEQIDTESTFKVFFEKAQLNPNTHLITGTICGYKIQEIENDLTRKVRYLDKLIDELAKGRDMKKILRKPK